MIPNCYFCPSRKDNISTYDSKIYWGLIHSFSSKGDLGIKQCKALRQISIFHSLKCIQIISNNKQWRDKYAQCNSTLLNKYKLVQQLFMEVRLL